MRAKLLWLGLIVSLAATPVRADPTHYVSLVGTNDSGNNYNTWSGAATQIQWAVDVAIANDTVLVTNGTYTLTNQISITKGITVQSVNGRTNTFIDGNYPLYTNRCVSITHPDAVLDGFTVANGFFIAAPVASGGGGIFVTNGLVRNCTITSNTVTAGAGEAYDNASVGGGGVFIGPAGILSNCIVSLNLATNFNGVGQRNGGGVFMSYGGLVVSCVITGNMTSTNTANNMQGGGVHLYNGGTVTNSDILNNGSKWGGGLDIISAGVVTDCNIRGNQLRANPYKYGSAAFLSGGTLRRCVISESTNDPAAGLSTDTAVIVVQDGGTIDNCVISNNYGIGISTSASASISNSIICLNKNVGVYISGGSAKYTYLRNSQIYGNSGPNVRVEGAGNSTMVVENCTIVNGLAGGLFVHWFFEDAQLYAANNIVYSNASYDILPQDYMFGQETNINYNCAGSTNMLTNTVGNTTNNPLFVNPANGDWRLSADSPCINTGMNRAWMTGTVDRDGRRRVDKFSGRVDMGCYEYMFNGTMVGFH